MRNRTRILAIASALSVMVSLAARAQAASAQPAIDTTHHGADSVAVQPKKTGMFGKIKGLAHNKTAQNIAKAAACTALPGGQYVVGAIDAKQNKNAGAVAAGAATAAVGAGTGCIPGAGAIPGMGGAGGLSSAVAPGGLSRMAAMQQAMAAAQPSANGGAAMKSDAPGQQMQLSGDVASELAKGKLVIKKVDWVQHGNLPSAPTTQSLTDVMSSIGVAIKQNGAKYRVDVYVGNDYSDVEAKQLAPSRITSVIGMINDGADVEDALVAGKAERDKEPRIEIVKVK